MAGGEDYSLRLSDAEVQRYRVMADVARRDEGDLWELAGITAGALVADVGCGPGALLPAISAAVGDTGRVIAIDGDPEAVRAATALAEAGAMTNVSVRTGRAEDTGLDPGSVDVVMMRHVLGHNARREQEIVNHAASRVRPGGCVFLVDSDGHAIRLRPPDPDVQDLMDRYIQLLASRGNDFLSGLRLADLISAAGLQLLEFRGRYNIVEVQPGMRPPAWAARGAMIDAGIATDADVARWSEALERGAGVKRTIFAPAFAAVGRALG